MADKKVITVDLLKAGVSSRSGLDYTKAVEMFDFEKLTQKRGTLRGEHRMPRVILPIEARRETNHIVREDKHASIQHSHGSQLHVAASRILQIDLSEVSHEISNIRLEGDVVRGEASACGPYAELFETLHERGLLYFGMRGFIERDGMTVIRIREIVTFDLVSSPL